jgi:hypothetical protein
VTIQLDGTPVALLSTHSKELRAYALPSSGTQFTCFTGTKVQILTQQAASADNELRILFVHYTKQDSSNDTEHARCGGDGGAENAANGCSMQCFHTREMVFSNHQV